MSAAREYLALLHRLPCVIHTKRFGKVISAEEAHHLESVRGDHSDFAAIPLCSDCHDSLHGMSRRAFHTAHKTDDVKLLAWTAELVFGYLNASHEDRESGRWAMRHKI